MVKVTHDKKILINGKTKTSRVTENINKKNLSKRSLGQLRRWKEAKKISKEIKKLPAPKEVKNISTRKIFNELKYYKTEKAKTTIVRRGKETITRKKNKTVDLDKPYYRNWWNNEKTLHEHSDEKGFQYRFIDEARYKKILQAIKRQGGVRVWALFALQIDWTRIAKEHYDSYSSEDLGEILPYMGFAGEIDRYDEDTPILLQKAKEGTAKANKINSKWKRLYDVAMYNMNESFGDRVTDTHFQGFIVSQRDIGKTKTKY